MTDKEILEMHPYKIWQGKNGYWYTYLPAEDNKKKTVKKKNREDIDSSISEFYTGVLKPKQSKNEIQSKSFEKLNAERINNNLSEYRELNVYDIKPMSYLISPIGNIYSLSKKKWLDLQIGDETDNYPGLFYTILVTNTGKQKRFSVAKLVLTTFVGPAPEDMKDPTVDHIDTNSLNNYYENLRWCERPINSSIRRSRGIGETNSKAILTSSDVSHICNMLIKKIKTVQEIADMYCVSKWTIQSIKDKRNWQYISQWFEFD